VNPPGHSVFDFLLVALAIVVLPALSILAGRRIDGAPTASLVPRYWFTIARGWLVVALIAWVWRARPPPWLGFDMPIGYLGLVGLGVVAMLAIAMLVQLTRPLAAQKPERLAALKRQMAEIKILPRTQGEFRVFLLVAVTAGVWEELLYRGFLFWFFAEYGIVASVAISTISFGAGHLYQGVRGGVRAFVLGLAFACAYALTSSLWWLIAIHALVDLFGGITGRRLSQLPETASAVA
jgi:uncharacterized protein